MRHLLKNGRIIDPHNGRDEVADVLLDNGVIAQIGPHLAPGPDAAITDCTGQIVAPGLIDIHVHLRVPGQEYKEDIHSGTSAAAHGGFTAIACQPNTSPPIDHASIVKDIRAQAEDASARVYVIAAVSKGLNNIELSEMAELKDAGAVAIGDDAYPVSDSAFLRRAMEYCRMLDLPFLAHCEDKSLTGDGVMNEGLVSTTLGLRGIPRSAENIGTARNVLMAMSTGCHLHVLHVSTRESVEIIRHAKKFGAPVTCETCPQYVALTDEACYGYDTNAKMSPPLRTKGDQDAIIQGLLDGTIDAIATDHAPHAPHEKEQEFARAPFGMLGLETSLALVITHLVKPGLLTLAQAIEKMSTAPARLLRLPGGTLSVGAPADITVFDPDAEWTVDVNAFKSKSRNSVLQGVTLTGRAVTTFVGAGGLADPALEAVLFDLDDTLHDRAAAGRLRAEAWVDQYLTPDGPAERAQMAAWLVALDDGGYGSKADILRRLQQRRPALTWDVETFTHLFVGALIEHMTLSEEARSLLEALNASHVPWGIVTNGPTTQRDKIRHLGLDRLTDCVLVSSECGSQKPDHAIFDAAADCLGVPAAQTLFVGDHCRNDVVGAHKAGMVTAWLAHGRAWPPEEATAPDHIVSSLGEVLSILNLAPTA